MKYIPAILVVLAALFGGTVAFAQDLPTAGELYLKGTLRSEECPIGALISIDIDGRLGHKSDVKAGGYYFEMKANRPVCANQGFDSTFSDPEEYDRLTVVDADGKQWDVLPWPALMADYALAAEQMPREQYKVYQVPAAGGSQCRYYANSFNAWGLHWSDSQQRSYTSTPLLLNTNVCGATSGMIVDNVIGFKDKAWVPVHQPVEGVTSTWTIESDGDFTVITVSIPNANFDSALALNIAGVDVEASTECASTDDTLECVFTTSRLAPGSYTLIAEPEVGRSFVWEIATIQD